MARITDKDAFAAAKLNANSLFKGLGSDAETAIVAGQLATWLEIALRNDKGRGKRYVKSRIRELLEAAK